MSRKPIDRLHGLPFLLIGLIVLVKSLDLFFIPNWVLGVILVWGAIAFMVEVMRNRKKSI